MDLLRLTAIAAVACQAANADPSPVAEPVHTPSVQGVAHPGTWRALPAVATATAGAVAGAGITVDLADAWGDPAMGCYAVWLALRGATDDPAALADQVIAGLTGLAPSAIARPSPPDGTLGFAFARPPFRGQARVRLATGRISAVACFGNDREPADCAADCTGVLEHAP